MQLRTIGVKRPFVFLQAVQDELGPAGVDEVAQEASALQEWQQEPNSPEALALVPSLRVQGELLRCMAGKQ